MVKKFIRAKFLAGILAAAALPMGALVPSAANAVPCLTCCYGRACCPTCLSTGNCVTHVASAGARSCISGAGVSCYLWDFGPCG